MTSTTKAEPLALSMTCSICGKHTVLRGSEKQRFWDVHFTYRTHCREEHGDAVENGTITKDILGREVRTGYGWTDDYVASKDFYSEEEIAKFEKDISELVVTAGTGAEDKEREKK